MNKCPTCGHERRSIGECVGCQRWTAEAQAHFKIYMELRRKITDHIEADHI